MTNFDRFVDYDGLLPESEEVYEYGEEQKRAAGLRSVAYLELRRWEQAQDKTARWVGLEAWRTAIEHEKSQRELIELDESLLI